MLSIDQQMESQQTTRCSRSSSPDLLSEDMRRERERQKWEEDAYRETVMDETREDYNVEQYEKKDMPVHYQSVKQEGRRNMIGQIIGACKLTIINDYCCIPNTVWLA